MYNQKNAITRLTAVALVVIIVLLVVLTTSLVLFNKSSATHSISSVSTSATTSGAASAPPNTSQLTVLAIGGPRTLDPAGLFSSEETLVGINVYQELVQLNGTSTDVFDPVLATSWSSNSNDTSFVFNLRSNAYFMNGDAFNASVVWFNFYRTIVMNQIGSSFFAGFLYNASLASSTGYAVPAGLPEALAANGYSLSTSNISLRQQQAANDLANILSHFDPSNTTVQSIMSYPNQAVVVLNNTAVRFNSLVPYPYFLYLISSSAGGQVDPAFVDSHGGVAPNHANTYIAANGAVGTAPYYVKSYVQSQVLVLNKNPNYWGSKIPQNQQNIMIAPAHIPVVVIEYFQQSSQIIQGLQNNEGALMAGPPIPVLSPLQADSLANVAGLKVVALTNAPTYSFLEASFDTQKYPTNITDFRLAVVHAINYSEIISTVAAGYGVPMVGPISPGLPYYNPDGLQPYQYDPELSISLLESLGFRLNLANGTVVNPSGKPVPTITFVYWNADPSETKIVQEVQIMLSQVGIPVQLLGETSSEGLASVSQPGTASSYPSLYIQYWYPSWFDPIDQDLVALTNVANAGIPVNTAWFNNSVVNNLTNQLPYLTNQAEIRHDVAVVYNITYSQAPYIWFYALKPYWVQRTYLSGVFYNPAFEGFYFPTMYYNTTA